MAQRDKRMIYLMLGVLLFLYVMKAGLRSAGSPVMLLLIAVNIGVCIYVNMKSVPVVRFGMSYDKVIRQRDYKRILTAMFTHGELWHLICNMVSIYNLMPFIERSMGSVMAALIYLGTGVVGGFISCLWHKTTPYTVSIGASGAVCGIFGFSVVLLYEEGLLWLNARNVLVSLVLLVGMTMNERIDSKTHFACLGCGVLAGAALLIL